MTIINCTILYFYLGVGKIPAFSNEIPRIFYRGVENQIKVVLNGCYPEDVELKIPQANVYRKNDSIFAFTVSNDLEEIKIKLYYKKLIVESRVASIQALPDPLKNIISLGVDDNGKIKKSDLHKVEGLSIRYQSHYPTHLQYDITSYNLQIMRSPNPLFFQVRNNLWDEKIKEAIKNLNVGDQIQILNIMTRNKYNGGYQNYPNSTFLIID
jgi:hypothetical protein